MSVPGYGNGYHEMSAGPEIKPGYPVTAYDYHGYTGAGSSGPGPQYGGGPYGGPPAYQASGPPVEHFSVQDAGRLAGRGVSSVFGNYVGPNKIGLWVSYLLSFAAIMLTTLWVYGEVKPKDTLVILKEAKLSNLILVVVAVFAVPVAEFIRELL